MVARHGQAVVLAMAFLQLLTAELLTASARLPRAVAAVTTGVGALLYAAGYVLEPWRPEAIGLAPLGAAMNAVGFAALAVDLAGRRGCTWARVILPILCLGMAVDGVMSLSRADPALLPLAFLGPEDGVRLRMLRLARVAATALSVTAFLYQELADRAGWTRPLARGGQIALWIGVLGMPTVLSAASFLRLEIKYLLPIPALAAFVGVCAGVGLAARRGRPLEVWGWTLIAVSMAAGLLIGTYAFDGPLPTPDFMGIYNAWPRRLTRLGHAYCILLGLLSIFLARRAPVKQRPAAEWLLALAGGATLLVITLVGMNLLPTAALAVGPGAVTISILLCLMEGAAQNKQTGKNANLTNPEKGSY
jgi:hypothetical protein